MSRLLAIICLFLFGLQLKAQGKFKEINLPSHRIENGVRIHFNDIVFETNAERLKEELSRVKAEAVAQGTTAKAMHQNIASAIVVKEWYQEIPYEMEQSFYALLQDGQLRICYKGKWLETVSYSEYHGRSVVGKVFLGPKTHEMLFLHFEKWNDDGSF